MLDPSLLLSRYTLPRVMSAVRHGELKAVIPSSFWGPFLERKLPAKVASFFAPSGPAPTPAQLNERLVREDLSRVQSYELRDTSETSPEFLDGLWQAARDETVVRILTEEWNFLNTHSWIASRTKRPFSTFVKAGAVVIAGGSQVLDQLVVSTLKKGHPGTPPGLQGGDRLQAACKWLALGGASASPFIGPPGLVALTSLATGYFLLFDP